MAEIYPQPDEFADVFAELLELAGDPRLIATTTDGPVPLGFVVSDELYQRWQDEDSPEASTPVEPKKRGRPRKTPLPDPEQEPTP